MSVAPLANPVCPPKARPKRGSRVPPLENSRKNACFPRAKPDWKYVPLGELCEKITKGSSPNWQGFDYCEKGLVFVRSQNVGWGELKLEDVAHLPLAFNEKEKKSILKTGDVLLNLVGASIGRACVASSDVNEGNVNQAVAVVRVRQAVLSPKFLMHYLLSPPAQARIHSEKVDVARANFSLEDTRSLSVPILPLPAQKRIVAEIEKQFTRLDAGIAALKRVQANLKRYRAAVLKAACGGKLVQTEAELARKEKRTYETGEALLKRILTQRRKSWSGRGRYKEPPGPGVTHLEPLPEGWVSADIEQVTNLIATGATPYRGKAAYWEGGEIPWVTSGALNKKCVNSANEFITPLAIEETSAKVFPVGTLLIALYGEGKTRGKVSELKIEAATNQACAALIFDNANSALRSYLRIFLEKNYEEIRLLSSGGVQPNLSLSIVKRTKLPIPPLPEQTRLVAEVERRLSVVDELEAALSANLQSTNGLRQSILQKAFAGELLLEGKKS
jgi:type I restriction enzyme S subunit